MATLNTKEIHSLKEYTDFVEQQTQIRWYRGCGDESYELIPSLYRHPVDKDSACLFLKEAEILKRFKQRSIPYTGSSVSREDDLSVLFIMQHFGVPTRLLDWTENPYIGIYFALTDAKYQRTPAGPKYDLDVAIWVLDPLSWNNKALGFDPPPGIISLPDDELLNGYLPSANPAKRKLEPVALYGFYNNPRIVAQKGVFTLFGSNIKPMEKAYVDSDYPQDCLFKLVVNKDNILGMLRSLLRIGFTDSVVFPDLPGLAAELKRHFGYWV